MCKEFFVGHSLQNGTRCRNGVNVLWYRSHLVWLVFEGSIPTRACFHSEIFFVTCSCCFVFLIEIVREKRDGKGRRGECMVCKASKHRTVVFTNKESLFLSSTQIIIVN